MTIDYEAAEQWARTILHGNHIRGRKNAAEALLALIEQRDQLIDFIAKGCIVIPDDIKQRLEVDASDSDCVHH